MNRILYIIGLVMAASFGVMCWVADEHHRSPVDCYEISQGVDAKPWGLWHLFGRKTRVLDRWEYEHASFYTKDEGAYFLKEYKLKECAK